MRANFLSQGPAGTSALKTQGCACERTFFRRNLGSRDLKTRDCSCERIISEGTCRDSCP